MGPLTFGLLPGNGGGNGNGGARACPAAHQLTFVVPPKKADPPAPPAAPAGEEVKPGFDAQLAEALRDAQVKLLKVRLGRLVCLQCTWPGARLGWLERVTVGAGSANGGPSCSDQSLGGCAALHLSSSVSVQQPALVAARRLTGFPALCMLVQDLKCETEDEKAAYEELQAQLLAAHPTHLPLLLERLQRAQRAAAAAKGDAAAQQVCLGALVWKSHLIGQAGRARLVLTCASQLAGCF